jgi:hypothetical protein
MINLQLDALELEEMKCEKYIEKIDKIKTWATGMLNF